MHVDLVIQIDNEWHFFHSSVEIHCNIIITNRILVLYYRNQDNLRT